MKNFLEIGDFLEKLKSDGIAITPEMYSKVNIALQIPNENKNLKEDEYIKLIIATIVSKNKVDFNKIKNTPLKYQEIPEDVKDENITTEEINGDQGEIKKDIRWDIIGYLLAFFVLAGILIWYFRCQIFGCPVEPPTTFSKTHIDRQTVEVKVENISKNTKNISMDFGDKESVILPIDSTKTIVKRHTYQKHGDYWFTIKADSVKIVNDSVKIEQSPVCKLEIVKNTIQPICEDTAFQRNGKTVEKTETKCKYLVRLDFKNKTGKHKFIWGDQTTSTIEDKTSVKHTYKKSGDYIIKIISQDFDCDTIFINLNIKNSYRVQYANNKLDFMALQTIPLPTDYVLNNNLRNLFYFLIAIPLILLFFRYYYFWGQYNKRKSLNEDGTSNIIYQPQAKNIKVSRNVENWAIELQQKNVGSIENISIKDSIQKTIRNAGLPYIEKVLPKQKARYLILIDDYSIYRQQAKYYIFLTDVLKERLVDLETFFYHADPRTCWNDQYPDGILIDELYNKYSEHNLILITEGEKLIDYASGNIYDWIFSTISQWEDRAIFTPVLSKNWHYVEQILAKYFVILPANPKGQALLKAYLLKEQLPSYKEIKDALQENIEEDFKGLFDKKTNVLSIDDIKSYLDEKITDNPTIRNDNDTENLLLQWALATAVYPYSNWEITLAIGKAIEEAKGVNNLVTTTNLVKISALPWLKQRKLDDKSRERLLKSLDKNIEQIARRRVLKMLSDLEISEKSRAFNEKEMLEGEQWLYLEPQNNDEATTKRKAISILKEYYLGDFVDNELIKTKLSNLKFRWLYYSLFLVVFLGLNYLFFNFYENNIKALLKRETAPESYLMPFYNKQNKRDKAIELNNEAAKIWNSDTSKIVAMKIAKYNKAIDLLLQSKKIRPDSISFINLCRLDFNLFNIVITYPQIFNKPDEFLEFKGTNQRKLFNKINFQKQSKENFINNFVLENDTLFYEDNMLFVDFAIYKAFFNTLKQNAIDYYSLDIVETIFYGPDKDSITTLLLQDKKFLRKILEIEFKKFEYFDNEVTWVFKKQKSTTNNIKPNLDFVVDKFDRPFDSTKNKIGINIKNPQKIIFEVNKAVPKTDSSAKFIQIIADINDVKDKMEKILGKFTIKESLVYLNIKFKQRVIYLTFKKQDSYSIYYESELFGETLGVGDSEGIYYLTNYENNQINKFIKSKKNRFVIPIQQRTSPNSISTTVLKSMLGNLKSSENTDEKPSFYIEIDPKVSYDFYNQSQEKNNIVKLICIPIRLIDNSSKYLGPTTDVLNPKNEKKSEEYIYIILPD